MKATIFFLLLLVISNSAFTQNESNSNVVFDYSEYDFGVMIKGSKAEYVFSFVNKGQTPVAIFHVEVSCGCTAPVWSKEPVRPNGSGKIIVKYNTNIVGSFNKTISVHTSEKNQVIALTIKGEVKKKQKFPKSGS